MPRGKSNGFARKQRRGRTLTKRQRKKESKKSMSSDRYIDIHEQISTEGLPGVTAEEMIEHGQFMVESLLKYLPKITKEDVDRWKRLRIEFHGKKYPGQFDVIQDDMKHLFLAWSMWARDICEKGMSDVEFRFIEFHEANLAHTGKKRKAKLDPDAEIAAAKAELEAAQEKRAALEAVPEPQPKDEPAANAA